MIEPITLADALAGKGSAMQLMELSKTISAQRLELHQRLEQLAPGHGSAIRAAQLKGDVAELAALDAEYKSKSFERAALDTQLGELSSRIDAARARESSECLPDLIKLLELMITRAEECRDRLQSALQNVSDRFNDCYSARVRATRANLPAAAAPPELVARLIALRQWSGPVGERVFSDRTDVAEELGIERSNGPRIRMFD